MRLAYQRVPSRLGILYGGKTFTGSRETARALWRRLRISPLAVRAGANPFRRCEERERMTSAMPVLVTARDVEVVVDAYNPLYDYSTALWRTLRDSRGSF